MHAEILSRLAAGGFTLDPRTDLFLEPGSDSGFFVGLKRFGKTFPSGPDAPVRVYTFIVEHAGLLVDDPSLFVGGWVEDGTLHLDVVRCVADLDEALALGAQEDQIAVFDMKACECIYLTPAKEAA